MKKIALYGGSFDPPHLGHLLVVSYVMGAEDIDELWIVPSYKHRDKSLLSFEYRFRMCEEMSSIFDEDRVVVSRAHESIAYRDKDFQYDKTIDLIRHVKHFNPDYNFRWVMGADLLTSSKTWDKWEEIEKLAPPIIVGRLGYGGQAFTLPNVSSSTIREHVRDGSLERLVPRRVARYIKEQGLYGSEWALYVPNT